MVPVFKNVRERCIAKNYHPVSVLSVVGKIFEKMQIVSLLIISRNMAFSLFPVLF